MKKKLANNKKPLTLSKETLALLQGVLTGGLMESNESCIFSYCYGC
jgi:hypothetical protein